MMGAKDDEQWAPHAGTVNGVGFVVRPEGMCGV